MRIDALILVGRREVLEIRVEHGLCFNFAEIPCYQPRPC